MSFILDALRKSETDRQQRGSAEFAGIPASNRRENPPRWLWVLGLLLTVNVIALLALMLRPDTPPPPANDPLPAQSAPATPDIDDFSRQVAAARQNVPEREESQAAAAVPEPSPPPVTTATGAEVAPTGLATIHELLADGRIVLPELHVDVHVYSESSEDRFVFINMNKHMEGSRLAEGPLVREITRDGVVLDLDGTTFLLPRD